MGLEGVGFQGLAGGLLQHLVGREAGAPAVDVIARPGYQRREVAGGNQVVETGDGLAGGGEDLGGGQVAAAIAKLQDRIAELEAELKRVTARAQ